MNPLDTILTAATRANVPYAAIVELTRRCNLHCRHCYAAPERGRPELTRDELFAVLDDLHALGALFITFSGGDPTVSRDFLPVLRRASELHMAVQFFSNGLLLDEKTADELAALRLFHAGISIYGATPETHDRITRRPGSLQLTLAGARRLKARGVHVVFKFIAMHSNVHEYEAVRDLGQAGGIPVKVDTVISPRDDLNRDTMSLNASLGSLREIIKERDENLATPVLPGGRDLGCVMGKTLVSQR